MILLFVQSILILLAISAVVILAALFLYQVVVYVEDHAMAAKKRIESIIAVVSALHLLLLLRSVSIFQIIFSLSIQYIFYNLLMKYPNFSATDPYFILGSAMALINHFLVLRLLILNYWIWEVIAYFLVFVWTTPFCFYVSLSVNDDMFVPMRNAKRETLLGSVLKRVMAKKANK